MNRNQELLQDFTNYCEEHPEMRFWQALCNWANVIAVLHRVKIAQDPVDTYYFEGRDQ